MSGNLALYCAASAKHDDFLIANDNAELWFLVMLLLVCNTLIQLVEDNTAASLGLLRTVANFFTTLNRQASFLKQTNIPQNAQMNFGSFVIQFQSNTIPIVFAWKLNCSDFRSSRLIHVEFCRSIATFLC